MASSTASGSHELRFTSLFNRGPDLSFPCGPGGAVDMDAMSDKARNNYLAARALIGRDYAYPVVIPTVH